MFVLPDPVTDPSDLSGAAFLYFEEPIIVTIPPQVVTPESFEVLSVVDERNPPWREALYLLLNTWASEKKSYNLLAQTLAPIGKQHLTSVMLSYPSNQEALARSREFKESAGVTPEKADSFFRLPKAASEFVRHVFLETYLDNDRDIGKLYEYIDFRMSDKKELVSFLHDCYLLRPSALGQLIDGKLGKVLLTNRALVDLYANIPLGKSYTSSDRESLRDVVAWEFFRRLVSPMVDPISDVSAVRIGKTLRKKKGEIIRLKQRCLESSYKVDSSQGMDGVMEDVTKIVNTELSRSIRDLFELDRKSWRAFVQSLFSDQKAWVAFFTALAGLSTGDILISAGGTIAATSMLGSKAFKAYADSANELNDSDFTLLYSLSG